MGIIGLLISKYIVHVTRVPSGVLAPIIVVLSVVGSYAINNNMFDVYVMVLFGLIGYFMRKTGFATAPVVLGLILGPMAESGFRRSLVMAKGDVLGYYFSRPLSILLMVLIVFSFLSPILMKKLQAKGMVVEADE
jgi:putative tricarboxylic transport membrane protein